MMGNRNPLTNNMGPLNCGVAKPVDPKIHNPTRTGLQTQGETGAVLSNLSGDALVIFSPLLTIAIGLGIET